MPKLFLSYADEDFQSAQTIYSLLKEKLGSGWDIFNFKDPQHKGSRWIETIEKEMAAADAFLALVSPHYLASAWCQFERELALVKDAKWRKRLAQFLWVAQIAPAEKFGILATYDWIDLQAPLTSAKIDTLIEKIRNMGLPQTRPPGPPPSSFPPFQNRRQELDDLIANLTNMAGDHFWQVLAAPQMGKTWLLRQQEIELKEKAPEWIIVYVDLRKQNLDARSNLSKLLSALFPQDVKEPVDGSQLASIASIILQTGKTWLLILDSAELISDDVAVQLRQSLAAIHEKVNHAGRRNVGLRFVAASRRLIPAWLGVIPPPRFARMELTQFTLSAIEDFLRETAKEDGIDQDETWFKELSKRLNEASEGLPELLVRYVTWIRGQDYTPTPDEILGSDPFEQLAKPYTKDHVLSAHSLIPAAGDANTLEAQRALLANILLGLSVYRRFTEKYFLQYVEGQGGFEKELQAARWTRDDLWRAVKQTYIMKQPLDIWIIPYDAIRRLLFRYHYKETQRQTQAHRQAVSFYQDTLDGWTGTDKAYALIEALWHQTESLRLSSRYQNTAKKLSKFASSLFEIGIHSNHHTDRDMATMIANRLSEDAELQLALEKLNNGLYAKITSLLKKYLN